tara:strand:- start:736 stop:1209 length:474 start_codon:yes stop_codon:yes gene_type:complete
MYLKDKFNVINQRVWQSESLPAKISLDEIKSLENYAIENEIRQFRYCLQPNNQDPMQQMIIFHSYPQVINWHCQPKGGLVFYYVIKGQIDIILNSSPKQTIRLAATNNYAEENYSTMVTIQKEIYRRISTNSQNSIFIEISSGTFADSDTVWKSSMD